MSNQIDFVLEVGEDFEDSWIWKDINKVPIPMDGWTAVLEIREAPHLLAALTLTQGSGITLGTDDGKITVTITKAQVDALTFRTGMYHLVLTDVLSVPRLFSRGTVTIIES